MFRHIDALASKLLISMSKNATQFWKDTFMMRRMQVLPDDAMT